ncbi:RNA 2'-phosphotransferase [Burkholderia arboris]|uniref:RNA 2'-phosphotransferase n=1 Tax=Burkholderia arboris TaxID=488730 RepID=UPI00210BB5A9|nr:RNA 2'-phosphotransferase [Burkholderia arboris]UTV57679.1 RNA 2'-phosphotransferase [Burkholderia arboris]
MEPVPLRGGSMQFNASKFATIEKSGSRNGQGWRDHKRMKVAGAFVPRRYPAVQPPERLYHGTATRFLDSIRAQGLKPGTRHHVHLSADIRTALAVGARYGVPVILEVAAQRMHRQGHAFFVAENGVWLTDAVPADCLTAIGTQAG